MTALPASMIAIDPASPGGPEVLQAVERSLPTPAAGEVLIKVAAAGVNRPDILQRRGMYAPPLGSSSIPGLEVAGQIVALGEGVDTAHLGQGICALVAGGGYAEYCAAPVGQCLPVPVSLSMIEAAAIPETLFTVWTNLFERAYAVEGDIVLIHGGTSGIGTMAIALGKLFGLTVIVWVRCQMRRSAWPRRGLRDQLQGARFRGRSAADHGWRGRQCRTRHGRWRLCAS
jgi:NADPH:quinone reductase